MAVDGLVLRLETQESQGARDGGRQADAHVEEHLGIGPGGRRVVDLQIEAVLEAQTEPEVQQPLHVEGDGALRLEPQPGDAQIEADVGVLVQQGVAEIEIPLDERVLQRQRRMRVEEEVVQVRVQRDEVGRRVARTAVQLEQVQAARSQEVEEHLRQDVLVGIGEVFGRILGRFDGRSQRTDHVVAQVIDEVRALGEAVADERDLETAELAPDQVLDEAERGVDAVDGQEDVVEEVEVVEVERRHAQRVVAGKRR